MSSLEIADEIDLFELNQLDAMNIVVVKMVAQYVVIAKSVMDSIPI